MRSLRLARACLRPSLVLFIQLLLVLASAESALPAQNAKIRPKMDIVVFDTSIQTGGQPTDSAVYPGNTITPCQSSPPASLYAFIEYENMRKKDKVLAIWNRDGEEIYRNKANWSYKSKGAYATSVDRSDATLDDGLYTLTIKVKGKKITSASVTLTSTGC